MGTAAYAVNNGIVGPPTVASDHGGSVAIGQVTIAAAAGAGTGAGASPGVTNLLYPGGSGDVMATIANANPYPVTITDVLLPGKTSYAMGYTSSALGTPNASCTAATSFVGWNWSTASGASSHALSRPLTVAADSNLVVTFARDATMGSAAPAVCADTFFAMPPMTGVTLAGGPVVATPSPAVDGWTG
jgi:hypothetical protein